ncbi:MAG: hypothetical protein PVH52_06415 [bacterium]|jgi:hypothetical protein
MRRGVAIGVVRIGVVALIAGLLAIPALPHPADAAGRAWEVMPYAWFTGIKGTMTIEGQLQGIDAGIADVWDNSNAGGNFRCETWKGGDGLYLDLFYVNLTDKYIIEEDTYVPASNIFFVDMAYNYELGSTPVFFDQRTRDIKEIRYLSFGVLAGGRYFRLTNSLKQSGGEDLEQTAQFIDPIIGGYIHYRMARAFTIAAAADMGGFGIGSDFTWNAWVRFDFRLADWLWVNALGRAFDIKYEEGGGEDKIGLNARIAGPAVGVIFRF